MIGRIALLGLSVSLSACSGNDATTSATNTVTPAARDGTEFTPPTTTSRLDYGSRMERRFQRMDANSDGKVVAAELPAGRGERQMKRLDTSGDGAIDSAEWTTGMMARFDRQDVNKDGSLTSEERGRRRGGGGGNRGGEAAAAADDGM